MPFCLPLLFSVPDEQVASVRLAVDVAIGVGQSAAFLASVYAAFLFGSGRAHSVFSLGFAASFIVGVGQIAWVTAGGGIVALGVMQGLGAAATVALYRNAARRASPGLDVRIANARRSDIQRLLSLGWRNSISSIAATLAFGSDVILVGLLLGPLAAGSYAVALKAYGLLHQAATGLTGALGPTYAHMAKRADTRGQFHVYCVGVFGTLALALPAAAIVGVYAPTLLQLWLGEVPASAARITTLLSVVLVLQVPGYVAAGVLLGAGGLPNFCASPSLLRSSTYLPASGSDSDRWGGEALGSLTAVVLFDVLYLPLEDSHPHARSGCLGAVAGRVENRLPTPCSVAVPDARCFSRAAAVSGGPSVLAVSALAGLTFAATVLLSEPGRSLLLRLRKQPL